MLNLTQNRFAYARELHNCAGTPVMSTDTLNDR